MDIRPRRWRPLIRNRSDRDAWLSALGVVPQHVVHEVRASLFDRDQPASREALVAHPRAKLTVQGRQLLVDRVLRLDGRSAPLPRLRGARQRPGTNGCAGTGRRALPD
jgi:hypothetical protein